jgi:Protein of unknown function (DUF2846)
MLSRPPDEQAMTRNHSTLAILALVCLLPSCAVPPPPQVSDYPGDFRGVEAAPASQSRIYLFRPAFSFTERKQDTPTCSIDGSVALMLAYGTFTSLSLPPGRHVLSLVPGDRDAPLWRSDFEFNVEAGRVYFVAVWLDLEIREQRQFKLMPLLLPTARGGLAFIPIPAPGTRTTIDAGHVRIEVVSEDDARLALHGARYVAARENVPPGAH